MNEREKILDVISKSKWARPAKPGETFVGFVNGEELEAVKQMIRKSEERKKNQ